MKKTIVVLLLTTVLLLLASCGESRTSIAGTWYAVQDPESTWTLSDDGSFAIVAGSDSSSGTWVETNSGCVLTSHAEPDEPLALEFQDYKGNKALVGFEGEIILVRDYNKAVELNGDLTE